MKIIKRILSLIIFLVVLFCVFEIYKGYSLYKEALEEKPLSQTVEAVTSKENYTPSEDIPDIYFDALVAVEDRRFYKHGGFDAIGTARAIINDIKAKKLLEGGSTITQQLAKNLYFPLDNSLERKIAEIFMAYKIEDNYSKDKILELYVNCVYYGSGYYSLYDASMGYFGKEPTEMSDFECTLLVGIPNAPSVYSLNENPDLALERQKKVISSMEECGYLTEQEAEELISMQENSGY